MILEDATPGTRTTKQMVQGGDMIVANLEAPVETGRLPFKTRALYMMFALTPPFTPARLRSENWP